MEKSEIILRKRWCNNVKIARERLLTRYEAISKGRPENVINIKKGTTNLYLRVSCHYYIIIFLLLLLISLVLLNYVIINIIGLLIL